MVRSPEERERAAAGRRRRHLVDGLTTPSSQLRFPGLEPGPMARQFSSNPSGKPILGSQRKHPERRLPYKDY